MEFALDGTPIDARGRAPYLERFIHGALYEARPDVMSVVHNHSESVIPFGVTAAKIKPIFHMGASIGHEVPVWDSHDHFGDTALLVENMEMGRDLAKLIGAGGTALMRGHGATVAGRNIRHAVYVSVYLEVNARLQKQAMDMGGGQIPDRRRGRQGRRAHRLLRHQPGLGELVPARRPPVAGRAGDRQLGLSVGLLARRADERHQRHYFPAAFVPPVGRICYRAGMSGPSHTGQPCRARRMAAEGTRPPWLP